MIGMDWIAEEPVPMTPTRRPVKSTPSWGHLPVWYHGPVKDSRPLMSGTCASDRQPVAMMQKRADTRSPRSVSTVHRLVASSNVAVVTRVSNWMSFRRSNRSATWLAYFKISGWAE
jgi:hypothetical protein